MQKYVSTSIVKMAETDKEIFKQFAEGIIPELKAVSSFVADTIQYEVQEKGLEITISSLINVVIYGRGPTKNRGGSGPTLQSKILNWINSKSITARADSKGRIPTAIQLSYMISKSIHRYGNLQYQRGEVRPVFDGIITEDRLLNLVNLVGDRYFNEISAINLGGKK